MVQWLLALMVLLVPPGRQGAEPEVIALGRYHGIAEDLARVVETSPPLFSGPLARERTAALVLAQAFHESSFKRDVDEGRRRGDAGKAACLMQMHRAPQGWTADELVADRAKCFRAGLELMRRSLAVCRASRIELRLAAFTGGRCDRGQYESERTFVTAAWLLTQRPPQGVAHGAD